MKLLFRSLPIALILLVGQSALAQQSNPIPDPLIEIPPGRDWTIVGEWDLNVDSNGLRYTLSILHFKDSYALVHYGSITTGCCWWPEAIPLTKTSDTSYLSALNSITYEVQPSATLVAKYGDGRIVEYSPTPEGSRFSDTWD